MTRICIVGAGMAGAIIASELLLLSKDIKVDLVDIDAIRDKFDKSKDLEKKVDARLALRQSVGYGFGGTSNLWHGVMGLFDHEDWKFLEKLSSKKLNREEIELNINDLTKYFGEGIQDLLTEEGEQVFQLSKILNTNRLSAKKYKVQLFPSRMRSLLANLVKKNDPRLVLHENSLALRFLVNEDAAIESLEVKKNDRNSFILADYFVVCSGGLESPRLLCQSFAGTEYSNSLVGKGLMDHPHALIGELVCQKKMFYRQHAVNSFFKSISTRIGFTFPILERKHKHLNHSVMIRPSFGASERDSRDALKQIVSNNNVFALMFGMLTDKTLFKAALVLLFEKLGIGIYTNRFLVSLQLEQTQLDGSCVKLTGSFDDKGRAVPKVVRKFGNELIDDIENIKDLMSDLCVDQSVFNRYDTDEENFVSGSHHSGTCRLGLSKHDSVVDINLKYHEINNLYVCDASIFPKIGNVNLSLSIGLFAIRLSKLLHKLSS